MGTSWSRKLAVRKSPVNGRWNTGMLATSNTVSGTDAVFPSTVAVIVAEPLAMAEIKPSADTVATEVFDETQVAIRSASVAPAGLFTVATSCAVPVEPIVIAVCESATLATAAGVTVTTPFPDIPSTASLPHAAANNAAVSNTGARFIADPGQSVEPA